MIENLAGNNLNRLFDRDIREKNKAQPSASTRRSFQEQKLYLKQTQRLSQSYILQYLGNNTVYFLLAQKRNIFFKKPGSGRPTYKPSSLTSVGYKSI